VKRSYRDVVLGRLLLIGSQVVKVGQPAEPGAAADRVNGIGLPGRWVAVVAAAAELGCSARKVTLTPGVVNELN
jgi:hypothetical protein